MSDNLRIISTNLFDTATLTVSSTASGSTAVDNLKINKKGVVWRTATTTKAIILATISSDTIGGVILPYTNLTSIATMKIVGYTGSPSITGTVGAPTITGGSVVFDTGTVSCCPWTPAQPWGAESIPTGANTYAYGGGQCARVWIPENIQAAATKIAITIEDTSLTYIEASRCIFGQYWSPTYNTSFGLGAGVKDTSSHARTIAGDLDTIRGTRSESITFDLKYLDSSDRDQLYRIIRGNGLPKPLFVSLFPDDADYGKEQIYQIYGKLSQLDSLIHPVFEIYSSSVTIESI
jgi:hypothetical protein